MSHRVIKGFYIERIFPIMEDTSSFIPPDSPNEVVFLNKGTETLFLYDLPLNTNDVYETGDNAQMYVNRTSYAIRFSNTGGTREAYCVCKYYYKGPC